MHCQSSSFTHFFCNFLHLNSFLFAYATWLAAMTVLSSITCRRMRVLIFHDTSACSLIISNGRRCYIAGSVPRRFVLSDRHRLHRDWSVSLEATLKFLCRRCRRLSSPHGIAISSGIRNEEWSEATLIETMMKNGLDRNR